MKMILAVMFTVLVSLTVAGSASAAEQRPDEMIVAMASFKSVCGGNTGRPCPGTAPATVPPVTPPVSAAPKPSPAPATPQTPPLTPTSPSTSHPMVTATLLGQTGDDVVGTLSSAPDGIKDVHIKLNGVSGTIKGVRITGLDGTWETPANGKNWIVAIRPQSDPSVVDLYFDFFKAITAYILTVTFSDGATQTLQAVSTTPTLAPAPGPSPVTITPSPAPAPTPTPITITPVPISTPTLGPNGSSLTLVPSDGRSVAFVRADVDIRGRALIFGNGSGGPTNDNSVRAFDGVTWETLWPNDYLNGGVQERHNGMLIYVPALDQLWIFGGSHLETLPGALRSGRFHVGSKTWLATSTTDSGAFDGIVAGGIGFHGNQAAAWSAQLDMGVFFGGSGNGVYDDQWIIERNSAGPEPYKLTQFTGPRPPARTQVQNQMVAVGKDFYLVGGDTGSIDNIAYFARDFWKFDGVARTWTRLADPPGDSYEANATYDAAANKIVFWMDQKLYTYSLSSNQWSDDTPAGLPCKGNQIGVYLPKIQASFFEGGNICPSGNGDYGPGYVVRLTGTSTPLPVTASPPTPAQPASPPAPASTLRATYLGVTGEDKVGPINQTTANGKPDFHISVSGLRGTPSTVTVTNDNNGTWESPFNSRNWIIATQYSGQNGDLWFEQYASNRFHVKVRYADGTTDEADATNQVSPTLVATPSPVVSPPAPPTPTPTPTPAPAAPSGPALLSSGWLNIPVGTWVSRPYPQAQLEARNEFIGQRGYGVNGGAGAKHERLVYNPDNKRVYFYSGDYFVPPFQSSFHTDMFSYDITKSLPDTSDSQNWILEWPYCGLPGQVSPMHTDEAPFAFDTKHHIFWITGGFEISSEDAVSMCGNGAIFYGASGIKSNPDGSPNTATSTAQHSADILTFDPATNRYARPPAQFNHPGMTLAQDGTPLIGGAQTPRHSIYNPVTNEIISFGQHGGWGNYVIRMNTDTGVWTRDGGGIGGNVGGDSIDGSYINDTIATHEDLALDVEHQWIYWIDTYHKNDPDPNKRFRLMRYDITNHNMASMGWITLPWSGSQPNFCGTGNNGCVTFPFYAAPYDSTMLVYDSINKVVLWPASSNEGRPILMIYHPDPTGGKNGSWEIDPMNRDKPNEIIFGSNGTFIPELNVMIIYGGFGTPHSDYFASLCPSCNAPENYFWLYRYGNGK